MNFRHIALAGLFLSADPMVGMAAAVDAPISRPVPETWLRYGRFLQYEIGKLVETSDDAAAVRLRTILETPSATDFGRLIVRVWIDDNGQIQQVSTPPRPTRAVENDLKSFLVGKTLSEAPPAGVRWPATLSLAMGPQAAAPSSPADR